MIYSGVSLQTINKISNKMEWFVDSKVVKSFIDLYFEEWNYFNKLY